MAEEPVLESYKNALQSPVYVGIRIGFVKGVVIGSYLLITYGAYSLSLWFGSERIADGDYEPGAVVNVLFAAILGAFSLAGALSMLQTLLGGKSAAAHLFGVIERNPNISLEGGEELDHIEGLVELKHVKFAYPSHPGKLSHCNTIAASRLKTDDKFNGWKRDNEPLSPFK